MCLNPESHRPGSHNALLVPKAGVLTTLSDYEMGTLNVRRKTDTIIKFNLYFTFLPSFLAV